MRRARRWKREDYARPSVELAKALLGTTLVRVLDDGTRLAGRIVETEAYLGVEDRAAHSYGGRRTPRNEPMYGKPGTSYIYFTYGMHHCFNIVCGEVDEPVAVLLRGIEPTEGIEVMRRLRRGASKKRQTAQIADRLIGSGPARLCQALRLSRNENMIDMTRSKHLFVEGPHEVRPAERIVATPRIGIGYAGEWVRKPLRFLLEGNPHVSR